MFYMEILWKRKEAVGDREKENRKGKAPIQREKKGTDRGDYEESWSNKGLIIIDRIKDTKAGKREPGERREMGEEFLSFGFGP